MYCDDMPGRSVRFSLDGEQLAEQRESAGLSQEALADAMALAGAERVSRGAVANWETGRTTPGAASLRVLIHVLARIHEIDHRDMRALLAKEAAA